jgi:hypothetical protein
MSVVLALLVRSIPSSVSAGAAPPAELDTGTATAAAKDGKMAGGFVAFAKVSTTISWPDFMPNASPPRAKRVAQQNFEVITSSSWPIKDIDTSIMLT